MGPRLKVLFVFAVACLASGSVCSNPGVQGLPFLEDVNGASDPEGPVGSPVVVDGLNFGTVSDTLYFSQTLGGEALAANVTTWQDDYIIATVPVGAVSGPLEVVTGAGGSAAPYFTITPTPQFTPPIAWKASMALPAGLTGHAAAFGQVVNSQNQAIMVAYVTGGEDATGTPTTGVYYAYVSGSGALGPWTQTLALPHGVAFHGSFVASAVNSAVPNSNGPGYLYVLGGSTDHSGTPSNVIYQGRLNPDGSVATWTTTGPLPAALHSFGVVLYTGHVYLVGGATTNNVPVNTAWRAVINTNGAILTPWHTEMPLPYPRARFGLVQFGTRLYAVGGDSGAVSPSDSAVTSSSVADIDYASIDLGSRDLSSAWTASSAALPAPRAGMSVLVDGPAAAGTIIVTGGLYTGATAASAEEVYVPIGATGVPGTPSNGTAPLNALCGCNLFNHAATAYVDTAFNYHVLVTGGNDANTPGTLHTGTYVF